MKTKIINISPDQNIIEHESGLKTVFVPFEKCNECIYSKIDTESCDNIPCFNSIRQDCKTGNFKKLPEP